MIFEKGTLPVQINLNQSQKIIGLWFGNYSLNQDTAESIISNFKDIEDKFSLCIIKNNQGIVLSHQENKAMAAGSSF